MTVGAKALFAIDGALGRQITIRL